MTDKEIADELFGLKEDILRSRNYYSDLLIRYRWTLYVLRFVAVCAGLLALSKWFDLNEVWARIVLLCGIVLPATKQVMTLPRRVEELEKQYRECESILNAMKPPAEKTRELLATVRERFSEVEKLDQPTIECLMAVAYNKALRSLEIRKEWKMSWFEKHIGIYCPWVKYDDHGELVDIQGGNENGKG